MPSWLNTTVLFHRFRHVNFAYSDFKLEPIFATAPAASKNDAHYKSGHKLT